MADINSHEAGNGGYRQREHNATAPVLYSTVVKWSDRYTFMNNIVVSEESIILADI